MLAQAPQQSTVCNRRPPEGRPLCGRESSFELSRPAILRSRPRARTREPDPGLIAVKKDAAHANSAASVNAMAGSSLINPETAGAEEARISEPEALSP